MSNIIIPQTALGPAAALRAIANKMDRREIRSFYVCVVDHKGGSKNTIFIDPLNGDADVSIMGNQMCDAVERLAKHVESGARIETVGKAAN